MPEVNQQELAVMNAEMAARIFMHIAQGTPSIAPTTAYSFCLTDQEQQALRDIFGAADPSIANRSPEFDASMGKRLG